MMSEESLLAPGGVQCASLPAPTKALQLNINDSVASVFNCFELAGFYLESGNHGAPNCPDISVNERSCSSTKPQAWSRERHGRIEWFYNYP